MSHWEGTGKSDEWYTPKYIFDALCEDFDMDVAGPEGRKTHVPCRLIISRDSLERGWSGFIWMNPPFGGRNGLKPWLDKFFERGNGIALTPDRTSAPWWQEAAKKADALLFTDGKPWFERPDGTPGKSPGHGVTLFASGPRAAGALERASLSGLGWYAARVAA